MTAGPPDVPGVPGVPGVPARAAEVLRAYADGQLLGRRRSGLAPEATATPADAWRSELGADGPAGARAAGRARAMAAALGLPVPGEPVPGVPVSGAPGSGVPVPGLPVAGPDAGGTHDGLGAGVTDDGLDVGGPHSGPHDGLGAGDGGGDACRPADDARELACDDACLAGLLVGLTHRSDPLDGLVEALLRALAPAGRADPGGPAAPDALATDPPVPAVGADASLLATAAAVAAWVSAGLDGADQAQRLALAAWAAELGAAAGDYRPGPALSARLTWACAIAERAEADAVDVIGLLVGNSGVPQECVPAAFAVACVCADVEGAQHTAYRLGGAAATITALAGALVAVGARTTPHLPAAGPAQEWTGLAAALTARRGA